LTTHTFTWRRRPSASRNPFPFLDGLTLKMAALCSYETSSQSSVFGMLITYRLCCGVEGPGFESWWGKQISLFFKTFTLALRATQPPIQAITGLFTRDRAAWGVKLTTHLVLVSTLTMTSYTVTPSVCLRDGDNENFTSFLPDKDCHNTYIRHCTECWRVFGFASGYSASEKDLKFSRRGRPILVAKRRQMFAPTTGTHDISNHSSTARYNVSLRTACGLPRKLSQAVDPIWDVPNSNPDGNSD